MAREINLQTYTDHRGNLTVIERVVPFDIKRIFYIYGVEDVARGQHRHKKTIQAAVCMQGSCIITSDDGEKIQHFTLDKPHKCLLLEPQDWHYMHEFSLDAILMVLASEHYDPDDYIFEPYQH